MLRTVGWGVCFFLAALGVASGQERPVFHDAHGKKIIFRVLSHRDGVTTIIVKTKRSANEYGFASDTLDENGYGRLGSEVVDDYSEALGVRGRDLRFRYLVPQGDSAKQIVYEQVYGGITVYGTEIRLFMRHRHITQVRGAVCRNVRCDTLPVITGQQAVTAVRKSGTYDEVQLGTPRLMILPLDRHGKTAFHLTWEVPTDVNRRPYVDARDGTILWTYSIIN